MIRGVFVAALAAAALLHAAAHAGEQPVRLTPMPPLAKGLAAFPRVTGGVGKSSASRINRALSQAERGLGCDDPKGEWDRTVSATMRGPRYLSLLALDDYYCGGAYPDTAQTALVFDLRTGAPIDWKRLFPAVVIEAAGTGPGGGDSAPVTVASAALWKLYAKAAAADLKNQDCRQVFADPAGFGTGLMLWPDAAADAVALQPAEFPHVVKACGPPQMLSLAELRKLGVSAEVVAALDQAHRRGWYDKAR